MFSERLVGLYFFKKVFFCIIWICNRWRKKLGVELPKGVILYKKIDCYSCLKARLRHGKFFEKTKFYSSLINEIISDTDYENLKRFYKLMHMKNLSDLKDIYNMQDTILLCKIFKNCSSEIMKKCPCNSRECTSASSLRKCFHTFLSKAMISLPTGPYMLSFLRKTLSHAVSHA